MLLPNEFLNTVCQLQNTSNIPIGSGKVVELAQDHMIITATSSNFPPLSFLSFVKVILNHPKAGYCVCVANVSQSDERAIRLSSIIILTTDEKRGYFRVSFDMPSHIYHVPHMNLHDLSNPEDSEEMLIRDDTTPLTSAPHDIVPIDVVIKDLSLSGVLFECGEYLQIGQRVIIEIDVKSSVEFFLVVVKRRFKNELEEKSKFQYGCAINEKNSRKIDALCRLILDRQAELIQKVKRKDI